jgi:hypothetical protein
MTAAERQARHRQKVKGERRQYQPPPGYYEAKAKLSAQGHGFERARREWGFEEGVFVDGAFLSSLEVIELAKLPVLAAAARIAAKRRTTKHWACSVVADYMRTMHVSFEEIVRHFGKKLRGFDGVVPTATAAD